MKDKCLQLGHDYAIQRDQAIAEKVAAMFTEDATLQLPLGTANGREEIAAHINATKEKRFSHHITSQSVELLNEETAKGIHYAIVNTVLPIKGEEHQVLVTGHYNDEYDISIGECLIKNREFKIHFINKST